MNSENPTWPAFQRKLKRRRKSPGYVHTAHKNGTMVTNNYSSQALITSTAQGQAFPWMDLVNAPTNPPCRQDLTEEVSSSARSSSLLHIRTQNGHSSECATRYTVCSEGEHLAASASYTTPFLWPHPLAQSRRHLHMADSWTMLHLLEIPAWDTWTNTMKVGVRLTIINSTHFLICLYHVGTVGRRMGAGCVCVKDCILHLGTPNRHAQYGEGGK